MREGYVNVDGGRVWYEIVGHKGKAPLIVVHGGPGYPHDYLEPLGALGDEREVIFYDQLGCGRSDRPDDAPTQRDGAEDRRDDAGARRGTAEDRRDDIRLWTVDRYVRELAELVRFLDLKEYHLLGQSWGAALAASFALAEPSGLEKLILSDPYLGTPIWMKDAARLRALLPKDVTEVMDRHEKARTTAAPEYKEAKKNYYKQFVSRLKAPDDAGARRYDKSRKDLSGEPGAKRVGEGTAEEGAQTTDDRVERSNKGMNRAVYETMWGPEEFLIAGTLKDFDLTGRLHEIAIPVLLLCGRYDEATPEATAYFQSLIPNARMAVFEESAHIPFITETDEFLKAMYAFL